MEAATDVDWSDYIDELYVNELHADWSEHIDVPIVDAVVPDVVLLTDENVELDVVSLAAKTVVPHVAEIVEPDVVSPTAKTVETNVVPLDEENVVSLLMKLWRLMSFPLAKKYIRWVDYLLFSTSSRKLILPGVSESFWSFVNEYVSAMRNLACEVLEKNSRRIENRAKRHFEQAFKG
ncbi:unnamed protein product [Fraxinus pennsylvanica]|uniref:Uncharacterized protein n=1 Tax=Fraxinus pennsylvanica TaxID=56036 RepID=A0AAD2A3N2_9LAMI|nr:unnamed protein product [Fraxinus pennsylvanica]